MPIWNFCEREAIRFDEEDTRNNNMRKRNFNPTVYVDDLSVHYFGMPEDAKFDIIEDEFLEVYLHQRITALRNSRIQEEVEYIKSFFTKVKVRTKKRQNISWSLKYHHIMKLLHIEMRGIKLFMLLT